MVSAGTVCVVSGPSGRGGFERRGAHLVGARVVRCRSRRPRINLAHERELLERTCRRDRKAARGKRGCVVAHCRRQRSFRPASAEAAIKG